MADQGIGVYNNILNKVRKNISCDTRLGNTAVHSILFKYRRQFFLFKLMSIGDDDMPTDHTCCSF